VSGQVDVLLASYNGERFLAEQLDSIAGQSFADWRLLVRDDGSTDGTMALLRARRAQDPGRVAILEHDGANSGSLRNFAALLERSAAPYAMFADQDDVWFPDKIAVTLAKMQQLERAHGPDCPLLVHTDMKVADGALHVIAESHWRFQKCDPVRGASLNRLLVQNCATGCSVMVNRALRELALPIPPEAMMHDWWLALVAAAFGRLGHVAAPTMLYRQHGANDVGARQWSVPQLARELARPAAARAFFARRDEVLRGVRRQARAFHARYAARLDPRQRALLEAYVAMEGAPWLRRKWLLVRHGFYHTGLARNVASLLLP
jgi:glycosyltransferase involved in cell wall biosynthesis